MITILITTVDSKNMINTILISTIVLLAVDHSTILALYYLFHKHQISSPSFLEKTVTSLGTAAPGVP